MCTNNWDSLSPPPPPFLIKYKLIYMAKLINIAFHCKIVTNAINGEVKSFPSLHFKRIKVKIAQLKKKRKKFIIVVV